jgi:hypothetical protein
MIQKAIVPSDPRVSGGNCRAFPEGSEDSIWVFVRHSGGLTSLMLRLHLRPTEDSVSRTAREYFSRGVQSDVRTKCAIKELITQTG